MLNGLWQDTRLALRMLRRQPAFATIAVLTLAIGIGANIAIITVGDALLLRPLPYPDSERLVALRFSPVSSTSGSGLASLLDLARLAGARHFVRSNRWLSMENRQSDRGRIQRATTWSVGDARFLQGIWRHESHWAVVQPGR